MRPVFKADYNPHNMAILPVLGLTTIECGNPECQTVHGTAVVIGWLFWYATFGFAQGTNCE